LLEALATDKVSRVRKAVAQHEKCPRKLVEMFATDKSWEVRWAVASRTDTPRRILAQLAADSCTDVRREVARNPSSPISALRKVAKSQGGLLHKHVLANPSCSASLRTEIEGFWAKRIARVLRLTVRSVKGNVRIRASLQDEDFVQAFDALGILDRESDYQQIATAARSDSELARLAASFHPNATTATLKMLMDDNDETVANQALMHLATRGD